MFILDSKLLKERTFMMANPTIVLLRKDFRLVDNPALYHACQDGLAIPIFIYDEADSMGEASKWWLHHALEDFKQSIQQCGSSLVIRKGSRLETIESLIKEVNPTAIYWNTNYEPDIKQQEQLLIRLCDEYGITARQFEGFLLKEPSSIKKPNGEPYKVFTAFYKALQKSRIPAAVPKITKLKALPFSIKTCELNELNLLPTIPWAATIKETWTPTEKGGINMFRQFLKHSIKHYDTGRDFPSKEIDSKLSPYLAFGQLSVRVLYHYLLSKVEKVKHSTFTHQAEAFIRQLVWRDFAYHLLYHFPSTIKEPLNKKFIAFNWKNDMESLRAWQQGQTGYPLVDAGMRQLWKTGFMHNRVRMVAASFLVKHLLIHWHYGAEWFWDTLVDADLANNTMGWQWVAGSGADAAPYFRIFNPITQSEKFDSEGTYIKKWLPELRNVPAKYIHEPWKAPEGVLQEINLRLGKDYPLPIIDHKFARERALHHYHSLKKQTQK